MHMSLPFLSSKGRIMVVGKVYIAANVNILHIKLTSVDIFPVVELYGYSKSA